MSEPTAQLSTGPTTAAGTVAGVDLKAIRARCGKGHVSLRHLAAQAAYCIDPMSDGGVAAAQSLADIPSLIHEVERLRWVEKYAREVVGRWVRGASRADADGPRTPAAGTVSPPRSATTSRTTTGEAVADAPSATAAIEDRCVVCHLGVPRHGGLCCAHRYDEQPRCAECPPDTAAGHARYGNCAPCSVAANRVTLCRVICPATAEDKFSRVECIRQQGHGGAHQANDGWAWT